MDHRKIISFGQGSFAVTIPKEWVTKQHLKKGDVVSIDQASNKLIMIAGKKERERKDRSIVIDMADKTMDELKAEIVTAYLNNYNVIHISSASLDNNASKIKSIIRNLSGMEIIDQTSTRITARDLIDDTSIEIEGLIRRADNIARSMISDTIACLEGKKDATAIVERDADINRLYYLGFRVIQNVIRDPLLMAKLNTTPWKLMAEDSVLARIEEIADRQKRISRLMVHSNLREITIGELVKLFSQLKHRYEKIMKAYYEDNKDVAFSIEQSNKKFIKASDEFLAEASNRLSVEIKKKSSAPTMLTKKNLLPIAEIVEHLKASGAIIKHIARTILNSTETKHQ